ncbi:hypothetical protein MT390_16080 [Vibrio sp. 2-Bac 85]
MISTGMIFLFVAIFTWVSGLWPEVKDAFLYIISWLVYDVLIPVWALFLIIPFLVFLIPLIQSAIPDSEPSFINYKSDQILGIDWTWDWSKPNYHNDNYSIKNLRSRCPDCKSSLEINDNSGPLVSCINDECKWQWQQKGNFDNRISHSSILNRKVWNIIDRKIHNDEFKT